MSISAQIASSATPPGRLFAGLIGVVQRPQQRSSDILVCQQTIILPRCRGEGAPGAIPRVRRVCLAAMSPCREPVVCDRPEVWSWTICVMPQRRGPRGDGVAFVAIAIQRARYGPDPAHRVAHRQASERAKRAPRRR